MAPGFRVEGKRLRAPKSVLFGFASYFTNTKFQSMTTLRILADEKLVFQCPMKIVARSSPSEMNLTRTEESEVDIPYAVFERLCQSKHVEISTGGLPIEAPEDALLKFRDIKKEIDLGTVVQ
jgi:hypothetical protein